MYLGTHTTTTTTTTTTLSSPIIKEKKGYKFERKQEIYMVQFGGKRRGKSCNYTIIPIYIFKK